jgi:hypothetical protein
MPGGISTTGGGLTAAVGGAEGGIIDELVIGRGQRTGTTYYFGEAGPERLTPLKGAGSDEGSISGVINEVRALRSDLRQANQAIARNTAEFARYIRRWDGDGMPPERTID